LTILIIGIGGCKKSSEPPPHHLFENEQLILNTAKEVVGEKVSFTTAGYFETDTVKSIVAGVEVSEKNEWGSSFTYKLDGRKLKIWHQTELLNGSMQCRSIK
jgi:hypothetical protein